MAKMGMSVDNIVEPEQEKVDFTKVKDDKNTVQDKETNPMLSSLPDVVQRTDSSQLIENVTELDAPVTLDDPHTLIKDGASDSLTGSIGTSEISRSSSEMSVKSSEGVLGHVLSDTGSAGLSHEGSPIHIVGEGQGGSLPCSLADLQDPKTFTLGAATGKKKITKASFTQSHSALADSPEDPSDPLSSLDPLWSIKKK